MQTLSGKALSPLQLDDDHIISDDVVGRLYHASESTVADLLERLLPTERANLAMFCYQKAHLHQMGLLIAATCELSTLVQSFGRILGRVIFDQSREIPPQRPQLLGQKRTKISVATFPEADRSQFDFERFDLDELVDKNQPITG